MSDIDGGAPAPADAPSIDSGVPIEPRGPEPKPLGSQVPPAPEKAPEPEPKKEEPSKSAGEAIRKANEQIKAKEAAEAAKPKPEATKPDAKVDAPKVDAKPEAKEPTTERTRAEDGKFAPKEGAAPKADEAKPASPHRDAPPRFDDAAKAEWEKAPESVKGAIHRTIGELEKGHQKYKESAEAYESVRQYDEMAKGNGRSLKEALDTYVHLDQMFAKDPIAALNEICQAKGFTLRQVAERIMGQSPDEQAGQRDQEIVGLKQTIARLEQQFSGIDQSIKQDKTEKTLSEVQSFAAEKPRFEELADAIKQEIAHGYSLQEAYDRAERLNPAPVDLKPLIPAVTPAPAQTRNEGPNPAGQKSISGAPSAGSDPARTPASSNREALKRAFARAG